MTMHPNRELTFIEALSSILIKIISTISISIKLQRHFKRTFFPYYLDQMRLFNIFYFKHMRLFLLFISMNCVTIIYFKINKLNLLGKICFYKYLKKKIQYKLLKFILIIENILAIPMKSHLIA